MKVHLGVGELEEMVHRNPIQLHGSYKKVDTNTLCSSMITRKGGQGVDRPGMDPRDQRIIFYPRDHVKY